MGLLHLEYPRLAASLDLPDALTADFGRNFSYAVVAHPGRRIDRAYQVRSDGEMTLLLESGRLLAAFANPLELMFALEEEIENALLACRGHWVGLHAGAAVLRDVAIVVVGRPDTGKTTTTFQLVELGLELLCEEVTLIDPDAAQVQPFPQDLTLARHYAEAFRHRYPVTGGILTYHEPSMARYRATRVATRAVPLGVILFPAYDPSCTASLEEVTAGNVLTDLLPHCFAPVHGDERLFDDVIRLVERSRLFTMRTRSIESARKSLTELIARVSSSVALPASSGGRATDITGS